MFPIDYYESVGPNNQILLTVTLTKCEQFHYDGCATASAVLCSAFIKYMVTEIALTSVHIIV